MNKTVFRIGFKLQYYIQELDRYKKSKNSYEILDWPNLISTVVTSLNSYKHGIFSSECPLKSLLVSEGL